MTITTFRDLGLSENVLKAISDAGYETPTPVQEKTVPAILMNRDVLACAQTGTGKTASFTLPMIDVLVQGRSRARMPRSVILCPTRELAVQVSDNFMTYGKYEKLTMALLIGGVSFNEQEQILTRGADVLIATPGRLLDHCERGQVILSDLKILVIDEADRMLDMGFIPDIERIVSLIPARRQTLMFSATMPVEIRKLAEKFLSNPKEITVSPASSTAKTIEQKLVHLEKRDKTRKLCQLLGDAALSNAIVFCNRKRDVSSLFSALKKKGFPVGELHGDMHQQHRLECLGKFREDEIRILVCSDVAARGLDIPGVSHVFNYDIPLNAEDYVHRIGRTGRAGRTGIAYSLVTSHDEKLLDAIENIIGEKIRDHEEAERGKTPSAPPPKANRSEKAKKESGSRRKSTKKAENKPAKNQEKEALKTAGQPVDQIAQKYHETDMVPEFLRRQN